MRDAKKVTSYQRKVTDSKVEMSLTKAKNRDLQREVDALLANQSGLESGLQAVMESNCNLASQCVAFIQWKLLSCTTPTQYGWREGLIKYLKLFAVCVPLDFIRCRSPPGTPSQKKPTPSLAKALRLPLLVLQ